MHRKHAAAAVAATAVVAAGLAAGSGPALASSHREAPNIAGSPRLDTTDVYAFLSPDKRGTATLVANWIPFEEPAGGPNFYTFGDGARYDINVDTNGDAAPDVVYRWVFHTHVRNGQTFLYNTGPVTSLDDKDLNIRQTYTLSVLRHGRWTTLADDAVVAPSNTGKASFPDYAALRRAATYSHGGRSWFAGQADDPFFADLRVFDLLYGGNLSETGNDTLRGYNVNSVAIQVPVGDLGGAKNVAGIWSSTSVRTSSGAWRQVSRLGNPLVNEVVVALKDKDRFNASRPRDDGQFLHYVTDPSLPKVLNAVYGLPVPATPRNDLVSVFLTGVKGINQPKHVRPSEMLRLNLTPFAGDKPSRLGVIGGDRNGFPNGRRLSDDVIDTSLRVVAGALVGHPNTLGDGVDANDMAFGTTFPYLALPNSGSSSVNTSATMKAAPAAAHTARTARSGEIGTTGGVLLAAGAFGALVAGRRGRALARRRARS